MSHELAEIETLKYRIVQIERQLELLGLKIEKAGNYWCAGREEISDLTQEQQQQGTDYDPKRK